MVEAAPLPTFERMDSPGELSPEDIESKPPCLPADTIGTQPECYTPEAHRPHAAESGRSASPVGNLFHQNADIFFLRSAPRSEIWYADLLRESVKEAAALRAGALRSKRVVGRRVFLRKRPAPHCHPYRVAHWGTSAAFRRPLHFPCSPWLLLQEFLGHKDESHGGETAIGDHLRCQLYAGYRFRNFLGDAPRRGIHVNFRVRPHDLSHNYSAGKLSPSISCNGLFDRLREIGDLYCGGSSCHSIHLQLGFSPAEFA